MLKYVVLLVIATVMIADAARVRVERKRDNDEDDPCLPKCKGRPLELSFVVDGSASIWPENFTYGLQFIEDFISDFDISPTAVRVSMVTYGDVVYTQDAFDFTTYDNKKALKKAISEVPYHSGIRTNTSGGIWHMLRHQIPEARQGVRRVVIVLTDGNSQEGDLTKQAADDARKQNLEVFSIGVGHNVTQQELHNIASDRDHVFVVSTYHMLEHIKDRLKYKACASTPSPPCKMETVDLSFVIDSSTSVGEGNFSIGMKFVTDFIDNFQINPHAVRVSAVTFADRIFTEEAFGFEAHNNKKDLIDRLEGIQWHHGPRTETGMGIEFMRTHQMIDARPSAAHICIVITDGESQEKEVTAQQAQRAQNDGIVMFAVGVGEVGDQLNGEELLHIAGDQSRVLIANNYGQLNLLKHKLTKLTCEGVVQALSSKASAYRD